VASSHPGTKGAAEFRQSALDWLQPKPLVPDFNDSDLRTIAALGGVPPPQFMKARTD